MKLSDGEKLILLMLTDIYKKLEIEGDLDPDFIATSINDGKEWGIAWKYQSIPFGSKSPAHVTETCDILDMWKILEQSYQELPAAERERVKNETGRDDVKFGSFDHHEEEHFSIAKYLIQTLGRYEHFKGRPMDAGVGQINHYRGMLGIFRSIQDGRGPGFLTVDEIIAIMRGLKGAEDT